MRKLKHSMNERVSSKNMFEFVPDILPYKATIIRSVCVGCKQDVAIDVFHYTCPACGSNLDLIYDYTRIGASWSKSGLAENPDRSLWRYFSLLPVQQMAENRTLQVGGTALVKSERLKAELGFEEIWIKDDTRNPSASLKDRASALAVQHASELGLNTIVAASTGNAAASLAALSANAGMRAIIFAPASASLAKLTQILQYGAILVPVDGNYDTAFDLAWKASEKFGWYNRNTGINPVLVEGKKTVAFEIAEQLNWDVPDYVLVPVGDGCILSGVYKGFYDLLQLGWIEKMPKLVAVQAEGSAAIVNAVQSNEKTPSTVKAHTIADSIAVDLPRDGEKALAAIRESSGIGITVSDDSILNAQNELARLTGIFAEPAASASYAGLKACRESGQIPREARVVLLATGSGLKDIPAAQHKIRRSSPIQPDMDAITDFLEQQGALG